MLYSESESINNFHYLQWHYHQKDNYNNTYILCVKNILYTSYNVSISNVSVTNEIDSISHLISIVCDSLKT